MQSKRDGRKPPLIRPLSALLALGAGGALSVAIAMASSTELGEISASPVFDSSAPVVAVSTVAGSSSYVTPDGVLTRWRFHAANEPDPGKIKLKIFRATGSPSEYKVVADSSRKDLDSGKAYSFDERIEVKQGDILGLLGEDAANLGIATPGQGGNSIAQFGAGDINVNQNAVAVTTVAEMRVAVAATVESDVDKDGYGDDTQDECPNDPKRHSNCPKPAADTRDPKVALSAAGKQNVIGKRGVTVTVASDESGLVTATGTLSIAKARSSKSYKLVGISRPITAGVKKTLKVGVGPKTRRKARRALRRHRKVRAHIRITVQDAAKNKTSKTTTVKVKRPHR